MSLWAQGPPEQFARTKVLALEHAWNQAEEMKDLKALDALFDNRLVYVDFDGRLMTKADFLSYVKGAHTQQVTTESMTAEAFEHAVIVTGTYKASEMKNGKMIVRHGRFTDTWIYKDSSWVCIAAQATPIAP